MENKKIIEVKEKKRISNNCSVGTYLFFDAKLLLEISKEYFSSFNGTEPDEFYIAPI